MDFIKFVGDYPFNPNDGKIRCFWDVRGDYLVYSCEDNRSLKEFFEENGFDKKNPFLCQKLVEFDEFDNKMKMKEFSISLMRKGIKGFFQSF